MSRESLPEMVDAYDTNTGNKVRVPRAWIGSQLYPHLSLTPKQAPPAVKPAPAKTATKDVWVKYATKDAPDDMRLSQEAAEAMTVDALHAYYTPEA